MTEQVWSMSEGRGSIAACALRLLPFVRLRVALRTNGFYSGLDLSWAEWHFFLVIARPYLVAGLRLETSPGRVAISRKERLLRH